MALNLRPIDLREVRGAENWLERFNLYCLTNKDINKDNKTAFYLTYAGEEAYTLLKDLAYPKPIDSLTPEQLHALLMAHIRPPQYATVERAKFNRIVRDSGESMRAFLLRIQQQASKCSFDAQLEENMRDRIVAGINDVNVERQLLQVNNLTFAKAQKILLDAENIGTAIKQQEDTNPVLLANRPSADRPKFTRNNFPTRQSPCDSCGGSHPRATCRFRRAKCHNCGKEGHIAKVCKGKKFNQSRRCLLTGGSNYIYEHVRFPNNESIPFIVDTGSPITILPYRLYCNKFSTFKLLPEKENIKGITGHSLPVVGTFECTVTVKNRTCQLRFTVAKGTPCILGLDSLGIIKENIVFHITKPQKLPNELFNMVAKCGDAQGGMTISPRSIECKGDAKFFKARHIPYGLRDAVQAHIKQLVEEGVIESVQSSRWASPIVVVTKSNGQLRMCGDYRISVNRCLHNVATTTMEPEAIFAQVKGSQFFSKIDLKNAFLQVPLTEEAKELTVINTPFGLYKYKFLPFGLSVSPSIFQSVVDELVHGISNIVAYQDDILVFSRTVEEHNNALRQLLLRLTAANVRTYVTKSTFFQTTIPYLGYILSSSGISPNPEKTAPIASSPTPTDAKQLRSFLGLAQYYSRFVPHFSNVSAPLYRLTNAEDFKWTTEHQLARKKIIDAILTAPVLQCYDPAKECTLTVDASKYALGAVLEQDRHPVIFVSRRLNKAEVNYSQTQKEALAIVWAVKRLHKYLFGRPFNIITDHKALTFIFAPDKEIKGNSSSMLVRWACTLSQYDYRIVHHKGEAIPTADFLSRYAHHEETRDKALNVQPFPVQRNALIKATREEYSGLVHSLRRGWSTSSRKRYSEFYKRRSDLSTTPDGTVVFQNRPVCPPSIRKDVLQYLHHCHLGRDKMVSMARNICWWPELSKDVTALIKSCSTCGFKPKPTSELIQWPFSLQPMQRVHVDYCGPFLNSYYGLVVIDSYSKYPEVFYTKSMDTAFTIKALRKFFAAEGVPQLLVSDNGPQFRSQEFSSWLRSIGTTHIFTPPRHPQSNGQAENFVRTLKTAIKSASITSSEDLFEFTDSLLLQYRSAEHSTTKKTPSLLFKSRQLRPSAAMDTARVVFRKGNAQFQQGGIIIGQRGNACVEIVDTNDGSIHIRHRDQIYIPPTTSPEVATQEEATATEDVSPTTVDTGHGNSTTTSPQQQPLRRSQRQRRPPIWHKDYVCVGRRCNSKKHDKPSVSQSSRWAECNSMANGVIKKTQ